MVDKSARISLLLGTLIITFSASVLLMNTVLFLFGLSISGLTVPVCGLITMSIGWWLCSSYFPENPRKMLLIITTILLVIFLAALLVNSNIYDTSFDGQTYHADAIVNLANGWNPVKTDFPSVSFYANWVGFFTKGNWILAATIYRFTGNIESGKIFNSLLLIASCLISYRALSTFPKLSRSWCIRLSLLLAFNPVSTYQLFTFYVDGQLASCLTILVALLIILSQDQDRLHLIALFSVLVLIVNIKLTAIIYVAVILGGFLIWYGFNYRQRVVPILMTCVLALSVAIFGVGYNPVVSKLLRNAIERGDPFYPTSWTQLVSMDINMPQDFIGKDRFWKLAVSLFSTSSITNEPAKLKIPFTFSAEELLQFHYPDARVGGFGVLFSGEIVLSVILIGIAIVWWRKSFFRGFMPVLLLLILMSVFVTSEGWWSRYAPQLAMLPILIIAASLPLANSPLLRKFITFSTLIIFINILLIGGVSVLAMMKDQQTVYADYAHIKQIEQEYGSISLTLNAFPGTTARFDQQHIPYVLTQPLDCLAAQQTPLAFSYSVICDLSRPTTSQTSP